jgi:hypothetical protein
LRLGVLTLHETNALKSDHWSAYLNHSQLAPSEKPAGYLHRRDCPAWPRGTDVPDKPGGFRAVLGRGRVGYFNPAARARMIAWPRSET